LSSHRQFVKTGESTPSTRVTTPQDTVCGDNDDALRACADRLVNWIQSSGMLINTNKTKELVICFRKNVNTIHIPRLCIHGNDNDTVTTFILGVFISSDLSRNCHVAYLPQKLQANALQ